MISPKKFEKRTFYVETLRGKNGTDLGLRMELGLLFLARPAGQSVLIPAGRPARRVYELRPAGRPSGLSLGFGRPAWIPLPWRTFWLAGQPAARLLRWLAIWLCLQLAKVLAGRPADGWLYLQLAKVLAGRPAGCLASWLAGTLARQVGLATWFRILVKVSAK